MDWSNKWDRGHPYCFRTWLRSHLPYFLINLGICAKGLDCEKVNGRHRWYNMDGNHSACYHCQIIKAGKLWESDV